MNWLMAGHTLTGVALAWVLWLSDSSFIATEYGTWNPKEAFDLKTECDAALQRAVHGMHETIRGLVAPGGNFQSPLYSADGVTVLFQAGGSRKVFTYTYQCFPESIDPRKKR